MALALRHEARQHSDWKTVMTESKHPNDAAGATREPALHAFVGEARRHWPELEVSDLELVAYVQERTGPAGGPLLLHAGDLLLACACARGLAEAIEAFRELYHPTIRRVCARHRADDALADDAEQGVYERLLVSRGEQPPRIAEYKGIGPLEGWVATTTSTTLLMLQRAAWRRREQPETPATSQRVGVLNPELEVMRARYKAQLEEAITSALTELGDRERTLLRLHLGERLNIDTLGSMYGVNRATAARWLVLARKSLLERARAAIRASLGASEEELDSLGALLRSQLHVSLARHLG